MNCCTCAVIEELKQTGEFSASTRPSVAFSFVIFDACILLMRFKLHLVSTPPARCWLHPLEASLSLWVAINNSEQCCFMKILDSYSGMKITDFWANKHKIAVSEMIQEVFI